LLSGPVGVRHFKGYHLEPKVAFARFRAYSSMASGW
jgi:hypothetical protein